MFSKILKPIHIIILFSLLVRIYHISFPVSGWHSWRQADTASIAKNFYQNEFNILYPQINWGGNTPGYVESEFQIYPFLVALLYFLFGVDDLWGRLLAVICSLLTIYGLYLLTKKLISVQVALWSVFIYAIIPLNIYYSRAFMPESMMMMFIIYGIYFFSNWCESQQAIYFIFSLIFISLSILIKITTLYIGLPLLYIAFRQYGKKTFLNIKLWVYAFLVLLSVFLWYYHAHNLFLIYGNSFGIWGFGEDKWGNFNLLIQPTFYNDIIFKSVAERHLTYSGFIMFIIGLFIKRQFEKEKLFDWWLISGVVYVLIVAGGNKAHEYYQLPLILPAAVFAGKTLSKYINLADFKKSFSTHKLRNSFFLLCLFLIPVFSFLRVYNFIVKESYHDTVFSIANEVKSNSLKDELIITVSSNNPIYLYLSDRKGWAVAPEVIDSFYIKDKINKGAKLLVGDKSYFVDVIGLENLTNAIRMNELIKEEKDYFIIKLIKR